MEAQIVLKYLEKRGFTKTIDAFKEENKHVLENSTAVLLNSAPDIDELVKQHFSPETAIQYLDCLLKDYSRLQDQVGQRNPTGKRKRNQPKRRTDTRIQQEKHASESAAAFLMQNQDLQQKVADEINLNLDSNSLSTSCVENILSTITSDVEFTGAPFDQIQTTPPKLGQHKKTKTRDQFSRALNSLGTPKRQRLEKRLSGFDNENKSLSTTRPLPFEPSTVSHDDFLKNLDIDETLALMKYS